MVKHIILWNGSEKKSVWAIGRNFRSRCKSLTLWQMCSSYRSFKSPRRSK